MVNSCCAVGCTNRYKKGEIPFHRFPSNPERYEQWVKAINRINVDTKKTWFPNEEDRVCGLHFQTGRASADKNHPDYIPNVFNVSSVLKEVKKRRHGDESRKTRLHDRVIMEARQISTSQVSTSSVPVKSLGANTREKIGEIGYESVLRWITASMAFNSQKASHSTWCCALNCGNARGKNPDLSFFKFPKDIARSNRWVINCRRQDLDRFKGTILPLSYQLCEDHFECNQFMNPADKGVQKKRKRLRHDAVPTLFNVPNPPPVLAVKRKLPTRSENLIISQPSIRKHLNRKRSFDSSNPPFVPRKFSFELNEPQAGNSRTAVLTTINNPVQPFDDETKQMLSAASQTTNMMPNAVGAYDPGIKGDRTVGCVGCFRRLQFGVAPRGLNFPSGSGVNVWCKVPEAAAYVPPAGSVLTAPTPSPAQKNMINLCNECFSAHMSGRKTFSLTVLGISIVTALYKEDKKYLKVEGPTKVVTLGGEPDSEFSSVVTDRPALAKKVPIPAKRRYPGRKILRPLTPPSDTESSEATSPTDEVREKTLSGRRKRTENNATSDAVVQTNPVNYLSVGSGYLGSVEMTDDCMTYDHITIKQEPPDLSEMCILPEAAESEEYQQALRGRTLTASEIKMEVDDRGS